MEELNTFRHRTVVNGETTLLDLGDRLVIEQVDAETHSEIHLTPRAALDLVAAIMSRLNA
jgi:hypothetical protein